MDRCEYQIFSRRGWRGKRDSEGPEESHYKEMQHKAKRATKAKAKQKVFDESLDTKEASVSTGKTEGSSWEGCAAG